ncbi:hypothetical protein HC028_11610 [Planosporangium flavigriseum]|uniref:Uncharacterized protein n=1 Tax=Planosporangium flavigriseum TaxID=373681 RepID=A0A8J3LV73_9ACTN|nr:hypothetical protein [Planosporangium flavigriseum]NJC65143.1 hypothetical protein [Planosporangium flavigriseum]GIG71760.1 hypothetical protein Pfl04_01640 [Planosporangium flavigriseum]
MPATRIDPQSAEVVAEHLGPTAARFTHSDNALTVLDPKARESMAVVTGFGPTNAPTAGTLSVMLGTVELQRRLAVKMTVVISDLGAWNSRNVAWSTLVQVRDQMFAFLVALGLDPDTARLRSHLDHDNLTRAGRIARYLSRADFQKHRESLLELYADHGLLGSETGVVVDSLYTVADVLGPFDNGATNVLMVSGMEEAYFTDLARLVLQRQADAGELSLGWRSRIGALYFRVLEGLAGYPKMSKSIQASSIHLNMTPREINERVMSDDEASQPAVLSAIELSSGWDAADITHASQAFTERAARPNAWREARQEFCLSFAKFAETWRRCTP